MLNRFEINWKKRLVFFHSNNTKVLCRTQSIFQLCVFLRFFYAPTRFASRGISLETFCLIIYCIFRASFCQAFSKFPTASFAAPATASSPRPSQQIIVLHLKWRRRQWRRRQRHKMSSHSSTILSSVKWPKSLARFPKMIWQPCLIVQSCLEFR